MRTDWFIFPPFIIYSAEELKDKRAELKAQNKKCIAVYFNMTEDELHQKIQSAK